MIEEMEQFRRELKSYKTYKRYIAEMSEELYVLEHKLIGLKGTRFDAMPSGTSKHDNRLHLIEKKDEIEKRMSVYVALVDNVDKRLARLTQEEQDILKLVYMENVSIRKIARTYYKSEPSMFRWINRMLKKATERRTT